MNILYLAHRIPFPPNKGDKLRAFKAIEHLSKRHHIWCACFVDRPSERRFIKPLSAYCEDLAAIPLSRAAARIRGVAGLLAGGTLTEAFYHHRTMERVVRAWASTVRFDAVVAFSSGMARYAFDAPARRRVLDLCDRDSQKWLDYAAASRGPMRWLYRTEGTRLEARERTWLATFDASVVITEAEAQSARSPAPPGRLHVVGNGVDINAETSKRRNVETWKGPNVEAVPFRRFDVSTFRRLTVGFVGVMDYRPNVDAVRWFVANCWRSIQKQTRGRAACGEAVFRIVGRSPTWAVRRLGRVPGVEVVGEVDDVQPELRCFDVSVAPLRIARGLQNKVLEAMAAAKPVVLSSRAAAGIAAGHGQEYCVADTGEEVTRAVVRLLSDPAERARLGGAARRFVAANHGWEGHLQKLELIVAGVIGRTVPAEALAGTGPVRAATGKALETQEPGGAGQQVPVGAGGA